MALAVVGLGICFGQLHVFTMGAVYLIPDSQIGRAPGPPAERRTRSRDLLVLEDCPQEAGEDFTIHQHFLFAVPMSSFLEQSTFFWAGTGLKLQGHVFTGLIGLCALSLVVLRSARGYRIFLGSKI